MPGSLGFGEILIIVLVALLVFGPKKLPEMGRSVGKAMREFRRSASELRAEIEDDVEVEPPTAKSDWQRRREAEGHGPAERAPDNAATAATPDPEPGGPSA